MFQEEFQAYVKLKELFSHEMTKYMIVVFNGMDELGDTIGIHLTLTDVIPVSVFFGPYGVDAQNVMQSYICPLKNCVPLTHILEDIACKSSWWSLGLEDDIICASYLWVREWLCRPILDLQSRAQSGHWKFAFVAGIQAAKWRRSLADCA